jgi:hypothetical protein
LIPIELLVTAELRHYPIGINLTTTLLSKSSPVNSVLVPQIAAMSRDNDCHHYQARVLTNG